MSVKFKLNRDKSTVINENAIRILTINKHRFVVGLQWETIRAQRKAMKEVKRIGKVRNLDVVATREYEVFQAGFAPKSRQKLRGAYSLIVAIASLLEGCCIAVIPLGVNSTGVEEYTLLGRTEKGSIHPDSDTIYSEDKIKQVVLDLRQDLRGNNQSAVIPIYGDNNRFPWVTDSLELHELLKPSNIRKEFKLTALRWGMTKNQLIGFTAALVMSSVAVLFILSYLHEQERLKQAAALARIMEQQEINKQARYKAAEAEFIRPWLKTSSVPVFLSGCADGLKKMHLSIEGWQLAEMICTQNGISASYNRPAGSAVTSEQFVKAVRKFYSTEPEFNVTQTSVSAFSISHTLPPNGDDPLQDIGTQLLKTISLFQSVNIPASLKAVEIKDKLKNEQGENLPLQPWQEYTFSVDTNIPPDLIFKNDEYLGTRLKSIIYEFGQDKGTVNYKITGSIYGKRNLPN